MIKTRHSAGGVIVNSKGLVAVVNQDNVSWSLPKGGIEEGESPQIAALREIEEETGLIKLDLIEELGTYQRHQIAKGGKGETPEALRIITLFLYSTPEEELAPKDPNNPEARWVEPDEVTDLLTHPKDKEFYLGVLPKVKAFINTFK
jgi:8-oxo-dGTP pyrophosphatase MutT (NUDIX family)